MDQDTLRLVKYINQQLNQYHGNRKEFVTLLENIGEKSKPREIKHMTRFDDDLWSMF